ncbi:MAG TPA: alpha/beta hydrolase [Thermoanaerobaculia bacterium]|nr:alpha/beta hydrolase [Thermoanaerobaculia bacterium]
MKRLLGRAATIAAAGASLYVAGSYALARLLAPRLVSPQGLGPAPGRHEDLLAALEASVPIVANLRHRGSARLPVELAATFASPGAPETRPTILFLHGKGGDASEWETDALRALRLGYNVLLPDLRGHGRSGGTIFTLGFLEKEDLALTVAAARDGFGIDADRLGIHSCSAGSSVALEFAAGRAGVRALWLESPFARPREMARHYLSRATHLPGALLALTSSWAISRAVSHVRTELGLPPGTGGLEAVDPIRSAARVSAAILLVHGEEDRLVPLKFTHELASALPRLSAVWNVPGAGHCHHDDEPAASVKLAYARKWQEFFATYLPA